MRSRVCRKKQHTHCTGSVFALQHCCSRLTTRSVCTSYPFLFATYACSDKKYRVQVQEICDAACNFILDAVSIRAGMCLSQADPFITPIARNVLAFLLPTRGTHYRPRSLWEFLFQLLHSPRLSDDVRGKPHCTYKDETIHLLVMCCAFAAKFLEAVTAVAATDLELRSFIPPPALQQLSHELARRSSRHRFRQHLAHVAAQAQARDME